MKSARAVSLSLVLVSAVAHASVLPNDAAKPLMQEAHVLAAQGKLQEAVNKYQAAAKADPESSSPVAGIANVLLVASDNTTGDNVVKYRQQAEAAARHALTLGADDPVAKEVLRLLLDDKPPPGHKASDAAWKVVQEGEVLFQSGKHTEALAKYEEAARLDPLYSGAWVYAGDCFYAQKNWPEAESRFRKATEIEPLNGQAWRFLSDALAWQGKWSASEDALLSGIAAQPNQLPTWDKLANARKKQGYPMVALGLKRKSSIKQDPADGKYTINLDPSFAGEEGKKSVDGAVWLALAAAQISAHDKHETTFASELASWQMALSVADGAAAKDGAQLSDPALKQLQMLAKADQLEAALLLLQYKESWRPEFEAWKKEHPQGIRKFVDTYALRP